MEKSKEVVDGLSEQMTVTRCAQMDATRAQATQLEFIALDACMADIGIHPDAFCQSDAPREMPAIETERVEQLVQVLSDFAQKRIAAGQTRPVLKIKLSGAELGEPQPYVNQPEGKEENPLMGVRGVSRYLRPEWAKLFAFQCDLIKRLRLVTGDLPLAIVIPFVRTYSDAASVHDLLAEQGLFRGKGGLQVHFMCDLPANAVMADKFLHYFDGMVIDLDQLAQFSLAIDPGNTALDYACQQNDAVIYLAQRALKMSRDVGKPCDFMGQAVQDVAVRRWLTEQDVSRVICTSQS
ncbi:putative PEP-binding protein [Photobacterium galatheae]|uniref:PEP-utilising enzyme C-terminal domain-containing protein n=1 Tax=Photobacterium galatheae TaxID=1654360 RepID=A0A066RLV0_9GAMM|nr:putative PEP-binding protein [Photobacterium galatheae]KDM91319.1 hypothetical protein EA58_12165 [Photobacterium galatheae]MCM0150280.1 phosphoenolpyruvate-utilizing protein [Photobacterium galatheae]